MKSAFFYSEVFSQYELGPLHPVSGYDGHDPARPYRLAGAQGQIGFISTVTEPFCAGCNRYRLTADGKLRLCLLRDRELDLLTPLRAGCTLEELKALLRTAEFIFWTYTPDSKDFRVLWYNEPVATCPIAAGVCTFYLP